MDTPDHAPAPAERRDLVEVLEDRYGIRTAVVTSATWRPPTGMSTSSIQPSRMPSAIDSITTATDSCHEDPHPERRESSTADDHPSVAALRSR